MICQKNGKIIFENWNENWDENWNENWDENWDEFFCFYCEVNLIEDRIRTTRCYKMFLKNGTHGNGKFKEDRQE